MSDTNTSDYVTLAQILAQLTQVVQKLGERVEAIEKRAERPPPPTTFDDFDQLVTLDQIAACVKLSKRSMEKHVKRMPQPKMRGRGGRAARWRWSEVRPWLEKEFAIRTLPERFPSWHEPRGGAS